MELEECLIRMLGYFVIQIHLVYNLPQIFDADKFRASWESSLLQMQKSLESLISEKDHRAILSAKKDLLVFILALRNQLGLL